MIRSTMSNCNHYAQEILVKIMKMGFEKMLQSRQKVVQILKDRYDACIKAIKKYNTPNVILDPAGGGFPRPLGGRCRGGRI